MVGAGRGLLLPRSDKVVTVRALSSMNCIQVFCFILFLPLKNANFTLFILAWFRKTIELRYRRILGCIGGIAKWFNR